MEFTGTDIEVRLLYVERKLDEFLRRMGSLADKVKAAAEQQSPLQDGSGEDGFYRFQVLSGVGAAAGATLGSGTVRLQTVIGGKRYNATDGTAGHYTDFQVVNDTFSPLAAKTYGICKLIGDEFTVLLGTCTASPTFSTDDITAPPGG